MEVQDVSIQCELMHDGNAKKLSPKFYIFDQRLRRRLMRRIYFLLMLDIVLSVPCLEAVLLIPRTCTNLYLRVFLFAAPLIYYILLYKFPKWRRYPPYNYAIYIPTALITAMYRTAFLTKLDKSRWLHTYPGVLIITLLVMVLFSMQRRIRFTHGMGILLIYLIYSFFLMLAFVFSTFYHLVAVFLCTLEAWYIVYDTHVILCSRRGHKIEPEEYFFAATNIRGDLPIFWWLMIRNSLLSPGFMIVKAIKNCRAKEIC